jgi:hypothetical protein
MGVDWQVSCTVTKCGAFSPSHTASGGVTMYTAPASVPSQLSVSSASVNLTAVSTADPTKSITVTLSIAGPPISIAFSAPAPPTTLQTNSGVTLNATILNDVSSQGADWALSCAGTGSACGSLSSSHTSDNGGSLVTNVYVAPPTVPAGGGYVTVTVTATGDKTKSASATIQITTPPVTVTFSQVPLTVPAGATASMTATVANDPTKKGVSWSVSCSSSSCGSFNPAVTASGAATTYTAPTMAPTGGTATVKAASVANSTVSVTSVVAITAPQAISISYTTPPPPSMQTGAQASIIATVANDTSNAGVDWSVSCGSGSTDCGSFSLAHTISGGATSFTAPLTSPSSGSVTITATATATGKSSSPATAVAEVAINSPGRAGLLLGQYAFSLSGTDSNGFYAAAGSVILDGNGNVTSGEEDFADATGAQPTATLTGTYSISNNGQGTMTLNSSNTKLGVSGVQTLGFVVVGSQEALLIEFDSSETSHGTLQLQTPSSFSQSAITGNYSFTLAGVDLTKSAAVMDAGGVLTADGKGDLTSVTEDVNDAGTPSSSPIMLTGNYTAPDSYGRGTAALGSTATYVYYVVNSGAIELLETDTSGLTTGSAFIQGSTSTTLSLGTYAFTAQGKSSSGALAIGGLLGFDGNGNVTGSTTLDVNSAGTVTPGGNPTGTYTAPSSGRGVVTLSAATGGVAQFAYYLTANQGVLLFELDSGLTSTGVALLQASGISAATFSGNYSGILDLAAASGEEDVALALTSDGVSTLSDGAADLNLFGTGAQTITFGGSFTANSNGSFSGSFALNTTPAVTLSEMFYVVNSSTVLFTDVDATSPGTGQLQLQQFMGGPPTSIAFTQGEAPPSALPLGQTATMAATVTNGNGQGVKWSAIFGSFNPTQTASGATTTYTAPNENVTDIITATALADQTQFVQAAVIVGTGTSIMFTEAPQSSQQVGKSAQISATVTNDPLNEGVNWQVTCASGSDCGSFTTSSGTPTTLTPSGSAITYVAPSTVPSGGTVTIAASAAVIPTAFAGVIPNTAVQEPTTITLVPPPTPTITISGGPSDGELQTSAQTSYTATVTNDTGGVTWSVSCSNGSDGCGSFSPSQTACGPVAQGACTTATTVYTAPSAIASGSFVTITLTATLVDDTSSTQPASLTIVSAGEPGLLGTGWFTFYVAGSDGSQNNSAYAVLGSVYLNGSGGIVAPSGSTGNAGEEDFEDQNPGNQASTAPIPIASGSYFIGLDGRGTMMLVTSNPNLGSSGTQELSFTVTSTQHALVTQFDGTAAATGSLDQQGSKLSQASVTGAYSFLLAGVDPTNGAALGLGGVVTADGAGNFSNLTEDLNDGGTVSSGSASGKQTYSALDSYGRGTATLGSFPADCTPTSSTGTFVFYIVDGTTLRLLENDGCGVTAGSMYTEGASLATGPYAFTVSGAGASTQINAVTAGGVFTLSGNAINSETVDVNNAGTVTQGLTPSGSYTSSSGGRFTLNFGTLAAGIQNFDGYVTASQGVLLLETDSTVTTGAAFPQTSATGIANSNYAMDFYGIANAGSEYPETASGQLYSDGHSLLAGMADIEQLGQPASPFENGLLFGNFTNCAAGRCTGSLTAGLTGSISENFYVVSSSMALFMETDGNGESTGLLEVQQPFPIPIPPEVVITSPAVGVQLGAQTTLIALVANDQANSSVNWTLFCLPSGTACGSITANTASGAPATYTAPVTLPGSATYLIVTVTATSANNPGTQSSVQVVAYSASTGELAVITEWPTQLLTGSFGPVSAVVINGPANPKVAWFLTCGGDECGTVPSVSTLSGATGIYTAPPTVPAGGSVTIMAAPAEITAGCSATPDPCTTETITITGTPAVPTMGWAFMPPSTMDTTASTIIEATVSGANDSSPLVTYSCTPAGSCGTFATPGGMPEQTLTAAAADQITYTAPTSTGAVTITATSVDDTSVSEDANITIQSPGLVSLLKGQYAISFSGTQANITGFGQEGYYAVVGSVNLNGLGDVVSGEEDYYSVATPAPLSGETIATIEPTGSSYTVNPDGTGTLILNTNSSGACLGVPQLTGDCLQMLQFVVVNSSHALVIEYDGSATSSGSLDLQTGLTASGFPLSSISGAYAFTLFGQDNSIPSEATAFGLGGVLTADPSDFTWSGTGDSNDDGVVESNQSLSGGYNDASTQAQAGVCGSGGAGDTDPCGRSSATIVIGSTTYNVVYYVVNQNYLKILDVDGLDFVSPSVLGVGAMYSAASPAELSTGNYVFTVEGGEYEFTQTSPPPVAAGGIFTSPGGSSGTLSGVTLDVNNNGKAKTSCAPSGTSTFSIGASDRGTLTWGTNTCAGADTFSNFAIYPTAASGPLNGGVLMLQIDAGTKVTITSGTAYPQASSPSFSGTYAGVLDSFVSAPTPSNYDTEQDMSGQITVSSSSICSGGTSCGVSTGMYINQADGDPNQTQAFGPYPASTLSGTFASGSNGRFVETVTVTVNGTPYTLDEIFYAGVNNNNTVLSLETDTFGTGAQSFQGPGVALLQIQNLTTASVSQPQDRAPNSATFKRAPSPGRAGEPPPPSQSLP